MPIRPSALDAASRRLPSQVLKAPYHLLGVAGCMTWSDLGVFLLVDWLVTLSQVQRHHSVRRCIGIGGVGGLEA